MRHGTPTHQHHRFGLSVCPLPFSVDVADLILLLIFHISRHQMPDSPFLHQSSSFVNELSSFFDTVLQKIANHRKETVFVNFPRRGSRHQFFYKTHATFSQSEIKAYIPLQHETTHVGTSRWFRPPTRRFRVTYTSMFFGFFNSPLFILTFQLK